MTINETQDEITAEFEGLTDWMDRYAYIIELGNTLDKYPESDKTRAGSGSTPDRSETAGLLSRRTRTP